MKKNSRTIIPTRFLPRGSKRITNTDGERVWLIGRMEFTSKSAYFQYLEDKRLADKGASVKESKQNTSDDSPQESTLEKIEEAQ